MVGVGVGVWVGVAVGVGVSVGVGVGVGGGVKVGVSVGVGVGVKVGVSVGVAVGMGVLVAVGSGGGWASPLNWYITIQTINATNMISRPMPTHLKLLRIVLPRSKPLFSMMSDTVSMKPTRRSRSVNLDV
jgi:hypothetical protein